MRGSFYSGGWIYMLLQFSIDGGNQGSSHFSGELICILLRFPTDGGNQGLISLGN